MNASRTVRVLALMLLFAPCLFAAEDLSGRWSGTFITTVDGGAPHDDLAYLVLKQTGADLTGTAGPNADQQMPIAKGKVETVKVDGKDTTKAAFDLTNPDGMMAHFDLSLVDGRLKGKATAERDGHTMNAIIDVARVK
jgi:hypothetical protein